MYPITSAVKALFDSEQRQVLRITGTDRNGVEISITDADVMIGGFGIDRYVCNGNRLEIGTAIAAEMTLRLDNRDGRFNDVIFEGTELFVEIGIADWTQEDPEVYYMPCGYFTPDVQPRSMYVITLHALDRMMKFDLVQPTLVPWTDGNGNEITDGNGETIYFFSDIAFPKTVTELVAEICDRCGVPFTQDLSDLPNYDYSISNLPNLQQEISLRNLIQWCAGLMGCNAWIDWDGELRFSWFGEATGYTSAKSNRIFSDLHEDDVTITGVQYTNTEDVTIISGSADYAIDMTGNYLVGNGVAQVLSAISSAINGFTYRPFNATVLTAPYLWPMDSITFTDKDGNDHTCVLTNVNFGINRNMELEGRGESAQTNKGTNPSGVTNEQAFLVEKVVKSLEDFDSSLSQEEVFRRLTNNGETQGVYMQDGKIYINGTYISAGFISANRIAANSIGVGKLTGSISGGLNNTWVLDLENGTFTIGNISAANITTGTLSADRIAANSIGVAKLTGTISGDNNWEINLTNGTMTIGTISANKITTGTMAANRISGGTLTLGGANNVNGLLQVLNASGNAVVTLNKDGANISEGNIVSYSGDKKARVSINTGALTFEGFLPSESSTVEEWRPYLRIGVNNTGQTIEDSVTTFYTGGSISFSPGDLQYFQVIVGAQQTGVFYSLLVDQHGITITGPLKVSDGTNNGTGQSGTFTTADGKAVTLLNGIATDVSSATPAVQPVSALTGVGVVRGGYIKIGRTVTFTVNLTVGSPSATDLLSALYGFPAPLYRCGFVIESDKSSSVSLFRRAKINTSGVMALIGAFETDETITISGSYISAS